MIKAIIIDDEHLARSIILEYLISYSNIKVVAECGNGFEGLKAIQEFTPDLVFLDIQMPKITGFEMLELTENIPPIIFTTAFDEFAIKAFETNAIDYLLKPFDQARFNKAIDKFLANNTSNIQIKKEAITNTITANTVKTERIVVKTGNKIKVISIYDIHLISAEGDYVNIHTSDGNFLKNQTLSFFEDHLDSSLFVRVHRSYIVKINQINKIEPYEKDGHILILKTGEKIPTSKTGYPKLKAVLGI